MTEKRTYNRNPATLERKAARQRLVDETYPEIGETLAAAIVDGGQTEAWAWDMLRLLGDYERWLIKKWVIRYKSINRPRLRWKAEAPRRAARKRAKEEERLKALRDQAKGA
jgi:hypothetical protein